MAASNEPHQLGSAGNGRIGAGAQRSGRLQALQRRRGAEQPALHVDARAASPVQRFADLGRPDRQDVAATAQRQHSMRHHDQLGQTVLPLDSPGAIQFSQAGGDRLLHGPARGRVAHLPGRQRRRENRSRRAPLRDKAALGELNGPRAIAPLRPGPGDHGVDIRPGCHLGAGRRFVELAHLDGRAAPQGRPAVRRQPPAVGPPARQQRHRAHGAPAFPALHQALRQNLYRLLPAGEPAGLGERLKTRPPVIPHLPKGYGKCGEALFACGNAHKRAARGESIPGLLGPASPEQRSHVVYRAPSEHRHGPQGKLLFRSASRPTRAEHQLDRRRRPPSQGGNALGQPQGAPIRHPFGLLLQILPRYQHLRGLDDDAPAEQLHRRIGPRCRGNHLAACIRQALHDLRKGLGAIIGKERKIGHHHQRGVLVGFKHRLGQHPRIQIPQEAGRRAAQPEYVFELEHHGCVLKCERRLAEPRRRDDKAQGAAILEEPRQKARSAPQTVGNHSVGAPPLASALLDETGHGHLLLLSALANNRSHLTRPRLSGQPARNIRPPIPFHCRPDKPPATCRQPRKRHPQAQGTREEGPWQASPVICGKASAPFALRASDKQSNGTRATGPRLPLVPPAESRQRPLPPQEGRRRQEIGTPPRFLHGSRESIPAKPWGSARASGESTSAKPQRSTRV